MTLHSTPPMPSSGGILPAAKSTFDLHDRFGEGPLGYKSSQPFPHRTSRTKLALTQHGPSHSAVSPDAIHVYIWCLPLTQSFMLVRSCSPCPNPSVSLVSATVGASLKGDFVKRGMRGVLGYVSEFRELKLNYNVVRAKVFP